MLLPLVVLAFITFWSIQQAAGVLSTASEEATTEIRHITRIEALVLRSAMPANDYLIDGSPAERDRFEALNRQIDSAFKAALGSGLLHNERGLVLSARNKWEALKPANRALLSTPDPVGNPAAAGRMRRLDAFSEHIAATLSRAHTVAEAEVNNELIAAKTLESRTLVGVILIFIVGLLSALTIGTVLTASILRPLNALMQGVVHFSESDLSYRVARVTNDEIGQFGDTFNLMADRLQMNQLALAGSEARFRAIAETAAEAIISTDARGKIGFVNRAAQRDFGYSVKEVVGKDISLLIPARFESGAQIEAVGLRKDRSEFPIELSVAAWESGGQAYFSGIIRDITERKATDALLKQLSITDSLTGLYNHAEFYRLLTEELKRSRRYGSPVSLLMLDIDYFKRINDTHGHQAGDNVLLVLADMIVKAVRPVDKAARYGGEEFAVILPETDAAGALLTAERLRERVEEKLINIGRGRTVGITVSIGVAGFPGDAQTEDTLVGKADEAMYASKVAGRNRVRALGEAA